MFTIPQHKIIDTDTLSRKTMSTKTMAFTGPRPNKLCGYVSEPYNSAVHTLASFLYRWHKECSISVFLTGGAQGFDQLVFWAVEHMRKEHPDANVLNILCIPFIGQEARWTEKGRPFTQEEYHRMFHFADFVHISGENDGTFRSAAGLLMKRNRDMADNAHIVMALHNGGDSFLTETGGTAACMKYVREKWPDKPMFEINFKQAASNQSAPAYLFLSPPKRLQ